MEKKVTINHQDVYTNKNGKTYDFANGFTIELVEDCGEYYANIGINDELVKGLPEYVDYRTLKKAILEETGIELPNRKDVPMTRFGRKKYMVIKTEDSKYWWQCKGVGYQDNNIEMAA